MRAHYVYALSTTSFSTFQLKCASIVESNFYNENSELQLLVIGSCLTLLHRITNDAVHITNSHDKRERLDEQLLKWNNWTSIDMITQVIITV